ncbi:hypothetical protein I4U23_005712 [Adineta vaga]|nr:hypothetical protein I4U23_005712 [Adineta vaga]
MISDSDENQSFKVRRSIWLNSFSIIPIATTFVSPPPPPPPPLAQQRYNSNNNNRRRSSSRDKRGPRNQPRPNTLGNYIQHPTNNNNNNNNNPNTTQPFIVQNQPPPQQQQKQHKSTTSSFRRQKKRNHQQQRSNQQHNNIITNNRFDPLVIDNDDDNNDNNQDNQQQQQMPNNRTNKKKKKTRYYLLHNKLINYFNNNTSNYIHKLLQDNRTCDGTKQFLYETAPIYDEQIRAEYELEVWKYYLELGEEKDFWTKEIINRIKGRPQNSTIIKNFVQKKINYYQLLIDKSQAIILKSQMEFDNFRAILAAHRKHTTTNNATTTTTNSTHNSGRLSCDYVKMTTDVADYIKLYVKHIYKHCEARRLIADAEYEDYQALEVFKKIGQATSYWNVHLMLKPKLTNWLNKNKDVHTIQKQIEYGILPKMIKKNNFSFKIDQKAFDKEDIQSVYDDMHNMTNNFQKQTMEYYYRTTTRQRNYVRNEIDLIIENCKPKPSSNILDITQHDQIEEEDNQEDQNDDNKVYNAFKKYYDLYSKRLTLEAEQSGYFLAEERAEERVERDINIIIPSAQAPINMEL